MLESTLLLLGSVFKLWQTKEAQKYADEYLELNQEYYAESNKDRPDMARLDELRFRIELLARVVGTAIAKPNSEAK